MIREFERSGVALGICKSINELNTSMIGEM